MMVLLLMMVPPHIVESSSSKKTYQGATFVLGFTVVPLTMRTVGCFILRFMEVAKIGVKEMETNNKIKFVCVILFVC